MLSNARRLLPVSVALRDGPGPYRRLADSARGDGDWCGPRRTELPCRNRGFGASDLVYRRVEGREVRLDVYLPKATGPQEVARPWSQFTAAAGEAGASAT